MEPARRIRHALPRDVGFRPILREERRHRRRLVRLSSGTEGEMGVATNLLQGEAILVETRSVYFQHHCVGFDRSKGRWIRLAALDPDHSLPVRSDDRKPRWKGAVAHFSRR